MNDLCEIGRMNARPSVLDKIYDDCNHLRTEYPSSYREFNYKILTDDTFERTRISISQ